MADTNAGNLSRPPKATAPREQITGPVPMRHRNRLGEDILKNPQGVGAPSREVKIGNAARKGW